MEWLKMHIILFKIGKWCPKLLYQNSILSFRYLLASKTKFVDRVLDQFQDNKHHKACSKNHNNFHNRIGLFPSPLWNGHISLSKCQLLEKTWAQIAHTLLIENHFCIIPLKTRMNAIMKLKDLKIPKLVSNYVIWLPT